MKIELHISKC